MIYFEVVIEGITYQYSKFNQARDEYHELKECGFHDAVLYRVEEVNGDKYKLIWSDTFAAFMG